MKLVTSASQIPDNFTNLYGKVKLEQIDRYEKLFRSFYTMTRQRQCYICSSSGRVELVGNHTDHNGGKVMGATVSLDVVACFLPRNDGVAFIRTQGFRDIKIDVNGDLTQTEPTSRGMIRGVLQYFKQNGYNVGGFSAYLHSTIPSGAGISSSAAFQMLVAQIQNHLYNDGKIDNLTLAKAGQYAENVYFNKPCGLMDQTVVLTGGIVCMDFTANTVKCLDAQLPNCQIVVVNTGKSHSRLNEHYATIPAEMKQVAKSFGKDLLSQVDREQFYSQRDALAEKLSPRAILRAEHFFEENDRVERAWEQLQNGNFAFASQLQQSGQSSIHKLQNCHYEGGDTTLIDAINTLSQLNPNGATRVHGGGFAGTVLCIVPLSDKHQFVAKATELFGVENVYQLNLRSVGTTIL